MASKQARRARLDELKAAREGGRREYKPNEADIVYDEVNDEDYRAVVKGRLEENDFIEDDDGSGYVDNGMDFEWDGDGVDYGSHDESDHLRKRPGKKKVLTRSLQKPPKKPKKSQHQPMSTEAVAALEKNPYKNPHKRTANPGQDEDFMASLFGELDGLPSNSLKRHDRPGIPATMSRPRKRKTEHVSSSDAGLEDAPSSDFQILSDIEDRKEFKRRKEHHDVENELQGLGGIDIEDVIYSDLDNDMVTKSTLPQTVEPKEEDDDITFNKDNAERKAKSKRKERTLVNVSSVKSSTQLDRKPMKILEEQKPTIKKIFKAKGQNWEDAVPTNYVIPSSDGEAQSELVSSEPDEELAQPEILKRRSKKSKKQSTIPPKAYEGPTLDVLDRHEGHGRLNFYWIDYKEDKNGIILLIGKVLDRNTDSSTNDKNQFGTWRSCCVEVRGLMRNIFVLPKNGNHGNNLDECEEEFESILDRYNIKNYMMKPVRRKYAFEDDAIPKETTWLKVQYPYAEPQLPLGLTGATFQSVFGTNQSAFELFVIKRRIFGPCWLEIVDPVLRPENEQPVSWCKLEVVVNNPKDMTPLANDNETTRATPPIAILSICMRTVVNHRDNRKEIVCATARVYQNSDMDDINPIENQSSIAQTWIRPLMNDFPDGFSKSIQNRQPRVTLCSNERMMLNALLGMPLIALCAVSIAALMNHDFCGDTLSVLLSRMKDLKCDHWSRIGRVQYGKRSIPKLKQGNNHTLLAGRLVCDLSSDGSKGHISSTTWSLTELCETYLGVAREDMDPDDTPDFFDPSKSPSNLLQFIKHCEADSYFQMAIASKVQLLPLTKQLTDLAGNSWNKTLNGGRAERNEYILLHEFHKEKYVCPDKLSRWEAKSLEPKAKKEQVMNEVVGEEEKKNENMAPVMKKDKYKGGLVFDPKKGLWDTFILVMDFNSLYPSIIQEFNIDFTTVKRTGSDADDKIPDVPASDIEQGVLPRLISNLVRRRRAVKSLMKDKSDRVKLLQWEIKQLALKLTANSMYGCLGFEGSRFYARPLAALTTSKGREILTNTKDLAESLHLDVIYGDTDSVMINTNVTTYNEAYKIGTDFKKTVNDKYKLLEIDIDAVFERMLLLQKKKYAAKKVSETGEETIEVKGLDMKRREYCGLSKRFSQFVLNKILSGQSTETVVEEIHEFLSTESARVRAGDIDMEEFIIYKRLGKNPNEYPDEKSLPHVLVAKHMLEKKQSARAGDVIPYIFCNKEDNSDKAKTSQSMKAHHPDELRRLGSKLQIDFEYYLSNQILPPIERLCDPIVGTDRARIAECLGLDPNRFRTITEDVEKEFQSLESQISDAERFSNATPFKVTCCHCKATFEFYGFYKFSANHIKVSGVTCPHGDCLQTLPLSSLVLQLDCQIRSHISILYEAWYVCDDPSCGNRTRMLGVYPKRCIQKGCRGTVQPEYSDATLYNQLLFYDRLFDFELARSKARGSPEYDEIFALSEHNKDNLVQIRACVQKHLDKCGRRFVDVAALFSFMKF